MITDADIKKLKTVFASKEDLRQYATKQELQASLHEVIFRMGEMKDEIKAELKQEITREIKEELITLKDYMVGEFSSIGQELALLNGHRDILEDHETRIKRLEQKKTN